ncbi:MAG TPA: MATE family efflux transporter, partial [Chlamydiales bacterium]|nr:MATE family efflux transporter [Chlamydiales bacterium]
MSQKNNLLDGSIFKSLISLAVPIIFANILQTTYQLIDTFWVGRLGTDAVAAVSISFPVIFLIISLGGGLVMAGAILIAQYKGSSNRKAVNHIASQTFVMVVVISIVLAMIGYLLSPLVVRLMGADTKVYTDAVLYMRVSFLGMIFMFVYMAFQSLMRGVGDVKTPLYIVLGTVFLNLVLDPLFIFGYGIFPGYGVTGAAIATIITEGLAALIGSFLLLKGRYHIKISWKDL